MHAKPIYPTDFKTYEEAVKMVYGEIETVDINTPLIEGTLISKRYCSLLPRLASSQVQELDVSAEDHLVTICGSNFTSMIFPLLVQTKLCNAVTKEEVIDGFRVALDQRNWGQYTTGNPPANWSVIFHSWRHRYATKMADLVDERSLGLATGHKTQAMLEHYANHANENHFKAVSAATEKAFGQVK